MKAQTSGAAKSKPLEKACHDFESIFVNLMLQEMRRTVPKDDLLNGGPADEIYTSMMDSEVAKALTQQRGLGLAGMLYRQLNALSESGGTKQTDDKSIKNP
jgi:flagellar protein FlgJ